MPADEELSIPTVTKAIEIFSCYVLVNAIPNALRNGVVTEKKKTMIVFFNNLYSAWRMSPSRPTPSNVWWKQRAAIRPFIVQVLFEAPNESPITTEWTTIPTSNTCHSFYNKTYIHLEKSSVINALLILMFHYLISFYCKSKPKKKYINLIF